MEAPGQPPLEPPLVSPIELGASHATGAASPRCSASRSLGADPRSRHRNGPVPNSDDVFRLDCRPAGAIDELGRRCYLELLPPNATPTGAVKAAWRWRFPPQSKTECDL